MLISLVKSRIFLINVFHRQTTNYAYTATDSADSSAGQTAYGALVLHRAVCGGYSDTYAYLLTLAGIENKKITGTTSTGGAHAWNLLKLNGNWYHADVTWDDLSSGDYKYSNFLLTDEEISKDHRWAASYFPAATNSFYSDFPRDTDYCFARKQETGFNGRVYYCDTKHGESIDYYNVNTGKSTTLWPGDTNQYGDFEAIVLFGDAIYVGTRLNSGGRPQLLKIDVNTGEVTPVTEDAGLSERSGYIENMWVEEESGILHCECYYSSTHSRENITIQLLNQEATTYSVTFDLKGGTYHIDQQTKIEGQPLKLSQWVPLKNGYLFRGWATSPNAENAEYLPGGEYTKEGNATLYAVWGETTFSVQFNANGGSGAPGTQKKYASEDLLLNAKPTRAGYIFQGWATSSGATTAQYPPDSYYTQNANATLYAVWNTNSDVTPVTPTSVTVSPTTLSLQVGGTRTLGMTVLPANATDKTVTWTSSNTSVATVSSSGVVTAKAAGSTTITAKTNTGNRTATCAVTVTDPTVAPTSVTVSPTTLSMSVNGTTLLKATVLPANATDKNVTWTSSNPSVATVSSSGLVTAKTAGSTTITVRTNTGSHTATCAVTVNTAEKTLTLDTPINDSFAANGMNWYKFTAPSAGEYVFATTGSYDMIGYLYANRNDSNVLKKDDDSGTALNFSIAYQMTAGQTVYLKARHWSNKAASYSISVTKKATVLTPTSVTLSRTTLSLPVSGTSTLGATVLPANATDKSVTWTSSNPSVATVSSSGVVTANAAGSATIKVKTNSGSRTATCVVTVNASEPVKTLTLNTPISDTLQELKVNWYKFTAPSTGEYFFATTGYNDIILYLYDFRDPNAPPLTTNDNGDVNRNSGISYQLTAGQTVHLRVRENKYNAACYIIGVEKK